MQGGEGTSITIPPAGFQRNVGYEVEGTNPRMRICTCGSEDRGVEDRETARVVSGRIGRVRKGLHPRVDGGFYGVKIDASEEMCSGARDPGF